MAHSELHETARALVAPGKGFLAADESDGTIKKRFTPINVTPVHEYERGSWGPAEADRLAPTAGWYAPRVSGQVVTHMHQTGTRNESTERLHPDGDSIIELVGGEWLVER